MSLSKKIIQKFQGGGGVMSENNLKSSSPYIQNKYLNWKKQNNYSFTPYEQKLFDKLNYVANLGGPNDVGGFKTYINQSDTPVIKAQSTPNTLKFEEEQFDDKNEVDEPLEPLPFDTSKYDPYAGMTQLDKDEYLYDQQKQRELKAKGKKPSNYEEPFEEDEEDEPLDPLPFDTSKYGSTSSLGPISGLDSTVPAWQNQPSPQAIAAEAAKNRREIEERNKRGPVNTFDLAVDMNPMNLMTELDDTAPASVTDRQNLSIMPNFFNKSAVNPVNKNLVLNKFSNLNNTTTLQKRSMTGSELRNFKRLYPGVDPNWYSSQGGLDSMGSVENVKKLWEQEKTKREKERQAKDPSQYPISVTTNKKSLLDNKKSEIQYRQDYNRDYKNATENNYRDRNGNLYILRNGEKVFLKDIYPEKQQLLADDRNGFLRQLGERGRNFKSPIGIARGEITTPLGNVQFNDIAQFLLARKAYKKPIDVVKPQYKKYQEEGLISVDEAQGMSAEERAAATDAINRQAVQPKTSDPMLNMIYKQMVGSDQAQKMLQLNAQDAAMLRADEKEKAALMRQRQTGINRNLVRGTDVINANRQLKQGYDEAVAAAKKRREEKWMANLSKISQGIQDRQNFQNKQVKDAMLFKDYQISERLNTEAANLSQYDLGLSAEINQLEADLSKLGTIGKDSNGEPMYNQNPGLTDDQKLEFDAKVARIKRDRTSRASLAKRYGDLTKEINRRQGYQYYDEADRAFPIIRRMRNLFFKK